MNTNEVLFYFSTTDRHVGDVASICSDIVGMLHSILQEIQVSITGLKIQDLHNTHA